MMAVAEDVSVLGVNEGILTIECDGNFLSIAAPGNHDDSLHGTSETLSTKVST